MKLSRPTSGSNFAPTFLGSLIDALTLRGRALLGQAEMRDVLSKDSLADLAERLISRRGEASGVTLARALLARYSLADEPERIAFLKALADDFGPDRERIRTAMEALDTRADALEGLHAASEPRRQELIRRLNLAPGGTAALARMREDLLACIADHPELRFVDNDFVHLFSSWFNRGFLVLRPIDWTTPANILEKIIRYEAVHAIRDWSDLRNRLEPEDRRCYGFFHPRLVDEPLIFVEVALTREIPAEIGPLLDQSRAPISPSDATTAVFYSISSTQKGLTGVTFGNFLIKQVVEDLKRELPNLKRFVTLSPVPGFARWLEAERENEQSSTLGAEIRQTLQFLDTPDWSADPAVREEVRPALTSAAAVYFLKAKHQRGGPLDPVARFHLGNGARLERLNFCGDVSPNGLRQSYGLMVNYLYDLDEIEKYHEAFAEMGAIAASAGVRKALPATPVSRDLVPGA